MADVTRNIIFVGELFYSLDALPVAQPTLSKTVKGIQPQLTTDRRRIRETTGSQK